MKLYLCEMALVCRTPCLHRVPHLWMSLSKSTGPDCSNGACRDMEDQGFEKRKITCLLVEKT